MSSLRDEEIGENDMLNCTRCGAVVYGLTEARAHELEAHGPANVSRLGRRRTIRTGDLKPKPAPKREWTAEDQRKLEYLLEGPDVSVQDAWRCETQMQVQMTFERLSWATTLSWLGPLEMNRDLIRNHLKEQ